MQLFPRSTTITWRSLVTAHPPGLLSFESCESMDWFTVLSFEHKTCRKLRPFCSVRLATIRPSESTTIPPYLPLPKNDKYTG